MPKGKTTKRKSASRMGRLMSPVDVTSPSMIGELEKRIAAGPFTLVLVYADWCGHCQRFKPMMSELESLPDRSIQTARVRDDMFPKSSLNGTQIDGYPSLLLVKPSGEVTKFKDSEGEIKNTIPDYTNIGNMKSIVKNVGTPEGTAALNASTVPVTPEEAGNSALTFNNASTPAPTPVVSKKNETVNLASSGFATPVPVTKSKESVGTLPNNILADRLSSQTVQSLNTQMAKSKNALLQASTKPVKAVQSGGSLFGHLAAAARDVAPAAALFLGASFVAKPGRRSRKKRSTRTKKTRTMRGGRRGCGCGTRLM